LAIPTIITGCVNGANDRVNIGMIGLGSHGLSYNHKNYMGIDRCRIIAVCDVDAQRLQEAVNVTNEKYQNQDVTAYSDFRELLLRKDIDAVQISTPDHWHVHLSILAMQAGKHVCCEKPTLTIEQGRILVDQIKKYGKVFQSSLEDRSYQPYHRMAELVRNGRIGKLQKMRVGLPGEYSLNYNPDTTVQPIPDYFDYEMWMGPAPYGPYSPGRCHWNFRWIDELSGGSLADWGAHLIDDAQWCNGTEQWGPIEVEGVGSRPSEGLYDAFNKYNLTYRYENGVELEVHGDSIEIYCEGSDGWLQVIGWNEKLLASSEEILQSEIGENEIKLYTAVNEHVNFVECIKEGKEPYHPAEDMHRTATMAHMGNIAMKLQTKLKWDPAKEEFIDNDEANQMRSRPDRDPWQLKDIINA